MSSPTARAVDLLVVLCLLMTLAVTGCQSVGHTTAELAAQLQAAWASGDEVGFRAAFADSSRSRAEQLWTATRGLRIETVAVDDVNDPDIWQVTWAVGEYPQTTTHRLHAVVTCQSDQCRLVDLRQASGAPAPAWITGDLVATSRDQVTVLSAESQRGAILAAAVEAMDLLRAAPATLGLDLGAPVVVEVPTDSTAFEQIMAAPEVDFRGSGAVTWTAGDDEGQRLTHVVINPVTTAQASHQQWVRLLAHEFVHLATAEVPVVDGRRWLVEGLAEALSLPADPAAGADASAVLAGHCPLAQVVIDDDAFTGAASEFAYAWSWWAVSQLLDDPARIPQLMVDRTTTITLDDHTECGLR